uniref:Uncharacterized protein n=1 Tax=Oryza sativa subsp. japonica TaxID=39947 RepID=Q6H514_ORYSJ|nr:hypothetical protein [Oryza sativa Japonica Group]
MPAQYHIVAQYKHSHISLESKKTIKKRKKQITRNSLASRSIGDGIREKKNTQEKDQIEQKGDQAMDEEEEKKKKNKQMDQEDGTKKMKLTKETKLPEGSHVCTERTKWNLTKIGKKNKFTSSFNQ